MRSEENLNDKIYLAIADMLKSNQRLKILSIYALFNLDALKTIALSLRFNYSLMGFNYWSTPGEDCNSDKKDIKKYLNRNRLMSPLLKIVSCNFILCLRADLKSGGETLFPEIKRLMIVNYLTLVLLNNPELLPQVQS